jgi:hypothetical protein
MLECVSALSRKTIPVRLPPITRILLPAAAAAGLLGCQSTKPETPPPPKTAVSVLTDDSIVNVDSNRSQVYIGDQGLKVNTPGTGIDISERGIHILTD